MRRALLTAPWVALAYGALFSTEARGTADVSTCVQVASEVAASGISLEVHNTCDFAVRCQLTWKVRCDGDAAGAAARPFNAAVHLDPDRKSRLFASGEACGAKVWEIVEDTWECTEVH